MAQKNSWYVPKTRIRAFVSIEDLYLAGTTQIECAELKKGQFPFLLSSSEGIQYHGYSKSEVRRLIPLDSNIQLYLTAKRLAVTPLQYRVVVLPEHG